MLEQFLRRFGLFVSTLILTSASILVSVSITMIVIAFTDGEFTPASFRLAILVPMLVAPLFAYPTLRLAQQLYQAKDKLHHLSTIDELTQAYNRRCFIEMAGKTLNKAKRYGEKYALIILDVDDFKQINDTYGHVAGDRVLVAISETCQASIRSSDFFARYGGEEFVFLMQLDAPANVTVFAERIRTNLSACRVPHHDGEIKFTVSMGVGIIDKDTLDVESILMRADTSLYAAKRRGKNRTIQM
jgi:diguanylate cyclase (GGDEF)-like protein